ncbi:MAG: PhnD/SsuA/transferrin family substrate-binding protein [Pseudomonadota bacterium]
MSAFAQVVIEPIEKISIALPLATVAPNDAGCRPTDEISDLEAKAYASLLEQRFNTDVTLCLTETTAEAVALAESGDVNLVWVDQDTVAPLLEGWRASLSLRDNTGLGRSPFVIFTRASDAPLSLGELDPGAIGFQNISPATLNIDLARRLLSDFGIASETPKDELLYSTMDDLIDAVESGVLDAGIVEANAWGRSCSVLEADSTICDTLQVIAYDRPRARNALMVPSETSLERHYRLVGVHIGLHLDDAELFEWISQGQGSEFDPAEPTAMMPKSADKAIAF